MIQSMLMKKYAQIPKLTFGDSPEQVNTLSMLVLAGIKTASCCAWQQCVEQNNFPQIGALSLVTDSRGRPCCVVQTLRLEWVTFDCVTQEMAFAEGEGDRSLASWRDEHERFFTAAGFFSHTMPLIFEHFSVIDRLEGVN
ncbi:hypothetical protein ED28_09505 [[Pantoea] beijingensis]|uniref:ASCH domain-containing protein n=1 Tax=[Pantoea] beijingensis TaxID=1324864 RepID=A0A443IDF3_9GAMM|nr:MULTISPECIES: ASCH domain-containing protein [Erwiniaceae]RWR01867.1 hypothetical protein ED28_09505 [[Pantoea] beijingensis]